MASEWTELVGSVGTVNTFETDVYRRPDGTVTIFSAREATYDAAGLARLRELLDRAAMPGQEGRRDDGEAAGTGVRSRCTWWSDPSDDFYGMCVKDAWHDREGDDEHENGHGIRWTGQRWEGARHA